VEAGVKKFIHVSSVAALGRIRKGQLINESMNWTKETSNSIYGHSKYLGEMEVWRGVAEGLQAVVVNPVIIIGPGNWETGSTKIFKSAYEEFPWYTEGITGFADVRDVSDAMIALMNSNISGERFIISGGNYSYKYIFEKAAGYFNKKPPYKKVAPFLAAVLWRLEALKAFFTGKPPLVTRETTLTAMTKVNYDNSKLLKALPGFQYRDIDTTIEYTCQALQQKLNKQ
jgi:nucleoside-diphosphate-sugar epimerase